jgi:hypothetical protein
MNVLVQVKVNIGKVHPIACHEGRDREQRYTI